MASDLAPLNPPKLVRRSTTERLREALLALAERHGEALVHRGQAWASMTFAGTLHTLSLQFTRPEAVAAGERFVAVLPEHEFAIPGQLVADATVSEVEHRLLPEQRLVVGCELLLLEEA